VAFIEHSNETLYQNARQCGCLDAIMDRPMRNVRQPGAPLLIQALEPSATGYFDGYTHAWLHIALSRTGLLSAGDILQFGSDPGWRKCGEEDPL